MKLFITTVLACISAVAAGTIQPPGVPFKSPVTVASGFSAKVIFSNLTNPRGIAFDSKRTLLVVERGLGVSVFTRVLTSAGAWERNLIIKNPNITHGIQVDSSRIYVSTASEVLAYVYDPSTTSVSPTVNPFPVIDGLPSGVLPTHTIQIETDATNNTVALLVGSGPFSNLEAEDPASSVTTNLRSQVRRFVFPTISPTIFPPPPLHWSDGQIIAYGLRNPAGFALTDSPLASPIPSKEIYIVDNGPSIDTVPGITAAFANDNPADKLGTAIYYTEPVPQIPIPAPPFYGFPFCATLWNPRADPIGVPQYVKNVRGDAFSLRPNTARNDTWCQDPNNNRPPAFTFQAHSVPLDIKFYTALSLSDLSAFPSDFNGQAFVSFHGSIERTPPTGYGVVRVPSPLSDPSSSVLGYSFLIQATNLDTCPGTCIRPVGLSFGADGHLYVSSDSSGELFSLERSITPVA